LHYYRVASFTRGEDAQLSDACTKSRYFAQKALP
jgi:hypothetical protein